MSEEIERFDVDIDGKTWHPKRVWGGHRFTDDEVAKLIAGEEITFMATSKAGREYEAHGKLGLSEFTPPGADGPVTFCGFQLDTTPRIPHTFNGHTFTDEEYQALENGETIKLTGLTSKAGKKYDCKVHWGEKEWNGKTSMGLVMSFD